ncbi:MAG: hypothetical protein M0Z99_22620 [Betaproteobacteria bacterium]|nr:hypothetical protein [Betaproteobacteria bacterium]
MFYSKTTGGFYDRAIHGDKIAADAVEITSDEHAALLTAQSIGKRIEADANGYPVAVDPPRPTLAEVQASALAAIDAAAAATRAHYITTADGQAATYLLKAADADRYKAAGYPAAQIASYPWVMAKAKAMTAVPAAADYQAAADLIISTRDAWVVKGAAIEEARERGKAVVAAAVDVAGVETARAAAVGELVAL